MDKSKLWNLNHDGFIEQFMFKVPPVKDIEMSVQATDQLQAEGLMRAKIVTNKPDHVQVDEKSFADGTWKIQAQLGSIFADASVFYSTPVSVEMYVATAIYVDKAVQVKARMWTYMSAALYCNGQKAGEVKTPVYKPIEYADMVLNLHAGKNLIYCVCENLGVRDTRNMLAIQIMENADLVKVMLPDESAQSDVFDAYKLLSDITVSGDQISMDQAFLGQDAYICEKDWEEDYEVFVKNPATWHKISDIMMEKSASGRLFYHGNPQRASVSIRIHTQGTDLKRDLELADLRKPVFNEDNPFVAASKKSSNNRDDFGFAMPTILARCELGIQDPEDQRRIYETLKLIEQRVDCADFELCGLLRLIHVHPEMFDDALKARIKEVFTNFRYWMNMKGSDAMCFWSENHSLMFYYCAMDAGKLYPDEYFPLADMTGKELSAYGRDKLIQWISDVEEYGFEEFQSAVYMCVTFAVVLNVIDFAEEALSKRMKSILDKMLIEMAQHTFKKCVVAPMGRVYRGILFPFSQGTQALVNFVDRKAPWSYGEGWISFLHGSSYQFPAKLQKLMDEDAHITYTTGNARIILDKKQDYCLTSVESPRTDDFTRWENVRQSGHGEFDTHEYNKSLNESFHGTSCFEPGTYGYQQHMWSAMLDPEAIIFANHPGTTSEFSDMRPGYWFGNGCMPAVKQDLGSGVLGVIYDIPDNHPIKFIHLYMPKSRFDQVSEQDEDGWYFVTKGDGFMGIWCSDRAVDYNYVLFDCEQRIYTKSCGMLVVCGSVSEDQDLEKFTARCKDKAPTYDSKSKILCAEGKEYLKYIKGNDKTQYLA